MRHLDPNLLGESAAILASCFWTLGSIWGTSAAKRIGSFNVNVLRSTLAIAFLGGAHVVSLGTFLPTANSDQWFWMGLSGIVGLGIGDFGLFAGFVTIGPRRTLMMQASSPIFASLLAFLMLEETLGPLSILGVAITLTGIVIVLLEREQKPQDMLGTAKRKNWGLLFALVSAAAYGFGAVLSKKGLYSGATVALDPLSAALIRMLLAGLFFWMCALFAGRLSKLQKVASDRQGMKYVAAHTLVAPFLGMTLSMVALANAEAGIASTLMSLSPVLIIPVIWALHRERTNWRGVIGAFVAVVGVAILFLT